MNSPNEGSRWFRRLYKDCKKISTHVKFKRIKLGFYRIYFDDAYIYEVYKEMPEHGYDIEDLDVNLVSQKYAEKYEDRIALTRKIKNFVEGYWEALDAIRTRVYMMKHDADFNKKAHLRYATMVVK